MRCVGPNPTPSVMQMYPRGHKGVVLKINVVFAPGVRIPPSAFRHIMRKHSFSPHSQKAVKAAYDRREVLREVA